MKKKIQFSKSSQPDPYKLPDDVHLVDFLSVAQQIYQNQPAFTVVLPQGFKKTLTYEEVGRYALYIRDYLICELNLKKGDRVGVSLPNCLAWPVVVLGILSAGCVLVNLNPLYQSYELNQVIVDSGAKCLFILDMFAHHAESVMLDHSPLKNVIRVSISEFMPFVQQTVIQTALRVQGKIQRCHFQYETFKKVLVQGHWWHMKHSPSVRKLFPGSLLSLRGDASEKEILTADDLAVLQYTGGTTGQPKAAMLTHRNLVNQAHQISHHASKLDMIPGGEINLGALPLYHIFAFSTNFLYFFSIGAHQILVPSPRPIENLRKPLALFDVTWIIGVNTLFSALCHEQWFRENPPKALKKCVAGGMGLSPEVAKKWQEITGLSIHEGYGMTETSPVSIANPFHEDPVIGSIGIPVKNCSARIVNDQEEECAEGEPGELRLKGPHVMTAYWNKPEATKETFDQEGWLKTGDIVKRDAKGFYYLVDRAKDMILVSGFNVYPLEIEHVIDRMPGVVACGVIGAPCEKTGEQVIAFVETHKGYSLSEEDVIAYTSTYLTRYKLPSRVIFIDELPKSNVGKVLRRELREIFEKSHQNQTNS